MSVPGSPSTAWPTGRTWLVVVDLQQIFATGPWAAPRFGEAESVIVELVAAYGDRTVCTRFVAPDDPEGAWRDYYAQWPFARQPPDAPDYALVDSLADHRDRTVDATTFGKWESLQARLASTPGDRLVVCGVSTDCCVLSTVLAAADAGMYVDVVADACAGVDDASHAAALTVMALYGPLVRVVEAASVLAAERATERAD